MARRMERQRMLFEQPTTPFSFIVESRSSDAGSVIRTEVAVTEQAVCVRTPRTGPHCNTLADCRCPPVQLGGPGAGIGSARRLPGRLRRLIYAYDRHVSAADLTQGEGVA